MPSVMSIDFSAITPSAKRLILQSLIELSSGRDVAIVTLPYEKSIEYCRIITAMGKSMAIELRNHTGNGSRDDLPIIRPRRYDAVLPLPTPRTIVLYDESARMETGSVRAERVRTVMTMEDDRLVRT